MSLRADRTQQMLGMREEGQTLQEIGDHFGLSRERIRQLVGPPSPRELRCRECQAPLSEDRDDRTLYCSRSCSGRAAARRALTSKCPGCGEKCRGEMCKPCKRLRWEAERDARYDQLEALWSEGLTMKQIAEQIGTTPNALGGQLVRARAAGRSLPFRRAKTPKSGGLTKAQSRFQFAQMLTTGKIRRPKRCEGCGEQTFVEAHHTDYQRPLYVHWLCLDCHLRTHGKEPLKAHPVEVAEVAS